MIFISAQPYDLYFLWQVEVQACNFRKHGISDKMHVCVWFPDNDIREAKGQKIEPVNFQGWLDLAKKYPEVKFFFYKDKGLDTAEFELYIPQLRPQILAKHFDTHPYLHDEVIFYHDSDIIFNYLPDFEKLSEGPTNWVSNTSHYLDYRYLYFKEKQGNIPKREAICKLAEIGGVSISTIAKYKGNTGGAQYILKNIDGNFWRDIEKMSIQIRKSFTHKTESNAARNSESVEWCSNSFNTKYFPDEREGFQSWCADMWAVNFALWSRNREYSTTPELDFSWATDSADTYLMKPIMHNAGATGTQEGVFFKGRWMNTSPIGKPLSAKKSSASWFYVQAIREASKITP